MSGASTDATAVEVFRHPDELPADVGELFGAAEQESVEFGLTWYRNLVDTVFAGHGGTYFYVVRRGKVPVAAIPILVITNDGATRVESLSNYYTAIYSPALRPDVSVQEIAQLLLRIRKDHPRLASMRFAPMDPASAGFAKLEQALSAAGTVSYRFFSFGNWFLRPQSDWAEYLKSREGMLRSTIKRMGKKFAAEGGTLEIVQGGEGLGPALEAYERVYAASWKTAEPYPKFMPGLMNACAERGWLRLGVARLKGEPVAAQLWIIAGGKANIYKLAYHEDYKAYAPGTLLTAMLMQHAMDHDHAIEIDYLIGDDAYKASWMSDRRERWGLIAYNPRSIAGLVGLARESIGRAVKSLKSNREPARAAE